MVRWQVCLSLLNRLGESSTHAIRCETKQTFEVEEALHGVHLDNGVADRCPGGKCQAMGEMLLVEIARCGLRPAEFLELSKLGSIRSLGQSVSDLPAHVIFLLRMLEL